MNSTFCFARFCSYFSYLVKVGYKTFLKSFAVIFGLLLLIIAFRVETEDIYNKYQSAYYMYYADPVWSMEAPLFAITFFGTLVVAAAWMFSDMAKKPERLSALMLPASQLEKYLAKWIVALPLTACMCILCFFIVDLIRVVVLWCTDVPSEKVSLLVNNPHPLEKQELIYVAALLGVQSMFVLGSAIWPKGALRRTFLALFVIGVVSAMWFGAVAEWTDVPGRNCAPSWIESIDEHKVPSYCLCGAAVFALVNYVLAYYRIREIELIQRW